MDPQPSTSDIIQNASPSRAKIAGAGVAIGAVIAAAVQLSQPLAVVSEGKANVAYRDRISRTHPATTCFGHTGPEVRVGVRYTDAQCEVLLAGDQTRAAWGVYRCAPRLADNVWALAAATDLAHNVGVGLFCSSTAARRFRAGDFVGGCQALGPTFTRVDQRGRTITVRGFVLGNGRVQPGLVTRRQRDQRLCETGRWEPAS